MRLGFPGKPASAIDVRYKTKLNDHDRQSWSVLKVSCCGAVGWGGAGRVGVWVVSGTAEQETLAVAHATLHCHNCSLPAYSLHELNVQNVQADQAALPHRASPRQLHSTAQLTTPSFVHLYRLFIDCL